MGIMLKDCFAFVSGGHISPILVACEKLGIRVVDTRHEVKLSLCYLFILQVLLLYLVCMCKNLDASKLETSKSQHQSPDLGNVRMSLCFKGHHHSYVLH